MYVAEIKKAYDFECSKILSHNMAKIYKTNRFKCPAFSGSSSYAILNNSIKIFPSNDDVSSNDASSKSLLSIPEKFSRFIQILRTMFAIPIFDAEGDIAGLEPASLVDDLLGVITTSTTNNCLSWSIIVYFNTLIESEEKLGDFLIKLANPPLLNHAILGYFIGKNFPNLPIHNMLDTLKTSLIILALTPPRISQSFEFNEHVRLTEVNTAGFILEEPEHKRSTT